MERGTAVRKKILFNAIQAQKTVFGQQRITGHGWGVRLGPHMLCLTTIGVGGEGERQSQTEDGGIIEH